MSVYWNGQAIATVGGTGVPNAGIPWHKGALRYFAEKGIKFE